MTVSLSRQRKGAPRQVIVTIEETLSVSCDQPTPDDQEF